MKVELESVSVAYEKKFIFEDFSASLEGPGLIGIIGENGSGKSTLIKTIAGIFSPRSGTVRFDGADLYGISSEERARMVGYVPQQGMLDKTAVVYDYIMLGRKPYFLWREREEDHAVVQELLRELDIEHFSFRLTGELSGGEQQKVVLARTLAQQTPVLLLDEPTNHLDIRYQIELFELLHRKIKEQGIVAIMAIHDLHLALRYTDRLILLKAGELLAAGTPESVVTEEHVARGFGMEARIVKADGHRFVLPVGVGASE